MKLPSCKFYVTEQQLEIISESRWGSREKWAGKRYKNLIPFHTLVVYVVLGHCKTEPYLPS